MANERIEGLESSRLARLLAIGSDEKVAADGGRVSPSTEAVLREVLAGEAAPVAGAGPVGRLLLDPATDLATLQTLKDYGKAMVRRSASEAERAAGTAVYYAAIAAAVVFHATRITRHSYPHLAEGLVKLDAKPWLPQDLRDLFAKARAICDAPAGPTHQGE